MGLEVQHAFAAICTDKGGHKIVCRIGQDLRRGPHLGDQPAGTQDHHLVAEQKGLVNVMRHKHDRFSEFPLQAQQLLLQFRPHNGVNGAEGLIHEQNVGIDREAARHSDSLLLAAGELTRVPVGKRSIKTDRVE